MTVTKINNLVYHADYKQGENISIFLASDIHIDNPKCRRELFLKHLKKCKDNGIKVAIFGDLFCLMQGKYDPRRSKKDIRPEHNKANYIDAVIDDTADLLKDYSDTIVFISDGNHETAILKNLETDVLERFCTLYNERYGAKVVKGGYRGWYVVRLLNGINKPSCTYRIYYHHGYGGGGEMTKGILQHSRMNMHIENADAIVMGHVHEQYIQIGCTEYYCILSKTVKQRDIYNVRTACYKDEFGSSNGGFHIERGRAPKPLGGILLNLEQVRTDNDGRKLNANYTMWTYQH